MFLTTLMVQAQCNASVKADSLQKIKEFLQTEKQKYVLFGNFIAMSAEFKIALKCHHLIILQDSGHFPHKKFSWNLNGSF